VCGEHSVLALGTGLDANQLEFINCTIPARSPGVFPVECTDNTLEDVTLDEIACLQHALNAAAYWVQTNDAIQATLSLLCADREAAELPVSDFVVYTAGLEHDVLKSRLAVLFESQNLPIVEMKANLHVDSEGEELHELDIYGMFDPKCSERIYLNSALVKNAMRSGSNSLQITFLIFAKIVHEFAHWVCHHTMKLGDEESARTPDGFFAGEAGEYLETSVFGGIVSHHSGSSFCPWEVELVVCNKVSGSHTANYFTPAFMRLFFCKNDVDSCTILSSLRQSSHTTTIESPILAVVNNVATDDEGVKHPARFHSHIAQVSMEGSAGIDFVTRRDVVRK
jgi:hypothetical protein